MNQLFGENRLLVTSLLTNFVKIFLTDKVRGQKSKMKYNDVIMEICERTSDQSRPFAFRKGDDIK